MKKNKSGIKSDLARHDKMRDEEIDYSDIPPLDERFWERAQVRLPDAREPVTLRLDVDVLAWFRAQGKDYETRINAVLRSFMEAQRRHR